MDQSLRIKEDEAGALKVLHDTIIKNDKARHRLEREVAVLSDLNDSHIVRIIDSSVKDGWFVTQYFPSGALDKQENKEQFKGKPLETLEAIRPLVKAVSSLHEAGFVHRDIKPANIFVSPNCLVLGDFGLVHFHDDAKTRISDTYENVGSRDWMPAWAQGQRLDDVKPSFDVYCLGKVIWAMISGNTFMRLWYFQDPEFNLEVIYPDNEQVRWINQLLVQCVVEREHQCRFNSATDFLTAIDGIIGILRSRGALLRSNKPRKCQVCGYGAYSLIANDSSNPGSVRNIGLTPVGQIRWRVFRCDHCGHIQMFQVQDNPPAWGITES
jgi:serine/threonine protein kinase